MARFNQGISGKSRLRSAVCAILAIFLLSAANIWAASVGNRFDSEDVNVVMILLDGVRAKAFYDLLDRGRLPNIRRHLADRGVRVRTCTTVFPSTTGPAYAPFVTGLMPGKAGLPGIRWYDRKRSITRVYCGTDFAALNEDLTRDFPTIYELLPPAETMSVLGMVNRGCKNEMASLFDIAPAKISGDFPVMDNILMSTYIDILKRQRHFPRYSFISLHAPDSEGHARGAASDVYYEAIEKCDGLVGNLIDYVRSVGLYDKTVFIVSSDHGQSPTDKHFNVARWLRKRLGLKVRDAIKQNTLLFNHSGKTHRTDYDCQIEVSGNNCVQIYFRGKKVLNRSRLRSYGPRELDVIGELTKLEGVNIVISRLRDGGFAIDSARGSSVIEPRDGKFRYRVTAGQDPLGYSDDSRASRLVGEGFHSLDEWFEATQDTNYPDALNGIRGLLSSDRAGDLVLGAMPGYEPWDEGQHGVHGGLERDQFTVPLLIAGPGVRRMKLDRARTVDVFPTVCRLLGLETREGIDGNPLPVLFDDLPDSLANYLDTVRDLEYAPAADDLEADSEAARLYERTMARFEEARDILVSTIRNELDEKGGSPVLENLLSYASTDLARWRDCVEALDGLQAELTGPVADRRIHDAASGDLLNLQPAEAAAEYERVLACIARLETYANNGGLMSSSGPDFDYLSLLRMAERYESYLLKQHRKAVASGTRDMVLQLLHPENVPESRRWQIIDFKATLTRETLSRTREDGQSAGSR